MLCSLLVLLVLDSLVRSGLPVLPVLVPRLVLAVLVLFVLAALVPAVLAVLVLVDRSLLAEAVCAFNGSGPTRASSSSIGANITGASCWRSWVTKISLHAKSYPASGTGSHVPEGANTGSKGPR